MHGTVKKPQSWPIARIGYRCRKASSMSPICVNWNPLQPDTVQKKRVANVWPIHQTIEQITVTVLVGIQDPGAARALNCAADRDLWL